MWLDQSKQGGEREEVVTGRGWGQVRLGLVGHKEDLGFYTKKEGSH